MILFNLNRDDRRMIITAAAVMASLTFGLTTMHAVHANGLPKESVLPLETANKAIQAAIETCRRDGHQVSVSVVDRAGLLRAMGRADGAGPHTIDSSRKKAYTASSMRRPTTDLAELLELSDLQALRDMNENILLLGGGLPIDIGGDVVGGIGVGGAPGAHLDDACAQAGLDAIIGPDPRHPAVKRPFGNDLH